MFLVGESIGAVLFGIWKELSVTVDPQKRHDDGRALLNGELGSRDVIILGALTVENWYVSSPLCIASVDLMSACARSISSSFCVSSYKV